MSARIRLSELQVEYLRGFKRRVTVVLPEGHVVLFGPSEAGKTTLLEAICWGLGGAALIDRNAISVGAERAKMVMQLDRGDGKTATVEREISRVGDPRVEIVDWDNNVISDRPSPGSKRTTTPMAWLKAVLGGEGVLNPLRLFEARGEQLVRELVKAFPGLDTREIDAEIAQALANRQAANAEAARCAALAESATVLPLPPLPPAPMPDAEVRAELKRYEADAAEYRSSMDKALSARRNAETAWQRSCDDVRGREDRIAELELELQRIKDSLAIKSVVRDERWRDLEAARQAVEDLAEPPADFSSAITRLAEIQARNREIEAEQAAYASALASQAEWERVQDQATRAKADAEASTLLVEDARMRRRELLAKADVPVPGLEVEGGQCFFTEPGRDRLPVSELSNGQRLRLAMRIAAAQAGPLRTVIVDDADALHQAGFDDLLRIASELGIYLVAARHEPVPGGIDVAALAGQVAP